MDMPSMIVSLSSPSPDTSGRTPRHGQVVVGQSAAATPVTKGRLHVSASQASEFCRDYNLGAARKKVSAARPPQAHQRKAIQCLQRWFGHDGSGPLGALLVLPTGGGKTYTAMRFLCTGPLSGGHKVLWLAHTHHLLEQAVEELEKHVGLIQEPKKALTARVLSSMPGHCKVREVRATDDVLVATIQTIAMAHKDHHPALERFLSAAGKKLFVVFDEAHHSPAYSYRTLLTDLRKRFPSMALLGLTATPTHTDVRKRGWLARLFPQGIAYQIGARDLMAAGILARPKFEDIRTEVTPSFDDREFQRWRGSFGDLPEDIVERLASNRERNDLIVSTYASGQRKYGKTLIFADRWVQCEYLREALRRRKIRADAVYSHVDADPGSAEARNRRTADENKRVLEAFRAGELDVLVNVRMLTEGTDVPDVQTVFLTRQTTSQILLTQMIGRSLRGPKVGGTESAHIVSFIDEWRHLITWAGFHQLGLGAADELEPELVKRPPLQLVSIDLVRRLARQMDSGVNIQGEPFRTILPVGWYRVEYTVQVEGGDDLETVHELVMVFEPELRGYESLISRLVRQRAVLQPFASPDANVEELLDRSKAWVEKYFAASGSIVGLDVPANVLHVARHVAQNEEAPPFFAFEERNHHDLDVLAEAIIQADLGPRAEQASLEAEFAREDRYWGALFPAFLYFRTQYDACKARLLMGPPPPPGEPVVSHPEGREDREPSPELRQQVLRHDRYRCLCCGETRRWLLQIDHAAPFYLGGSTKLANLQTLCRQCNNDKDINTIDFHSHESLLRAAPSELGELRPPSGTQLERTDSWVRFVRRTVNLFYRCAAVDEVTVRIAGPAAATWCVSLYQGNDPAWLEAHSAALLKIIREALSGTCISGPKRLVVTVPAGQGGQEP